MDEQHLLLFLLQVFLLLSLARGFGELLRQWGHPPLVGEMLIGIALGPTLLGRFAPELQTVLFPPDLVQRTMLETVAWFGALFLLLETGLEVDVSAAWRHVTVVSIVGKFAGAWLGTFGTSLSRDDRLAVGIAFTPGGVTEILLAKVALEHHIFTEPVFVAVV